MKILDLSCNRCGASLDVPEKVNFVTCTFCGAKLRVERSGSAAYTETLEQIADDLGALRRQAEVDRLDRGWQMRRDELLVTDKHGARHVPTKRGAVIGLVLTIVFGVVWSVIASAVAGPFGFFGLVFVAFGLFASITGMRKAETYERERGAYERERQALTADLER